MKLSRPAPYRSLTLVLMLILLALLLLLLDHAGRLGPLRSQAQTLISPALSGLARLNNSVNAVGRDLSEVQQLRERVRELEAELSQVEADKIMLHAQATEIEQLRRQLGIEQSRPWKLVGAEVMAFTPDDGRRILFLSAGSNDGVEPGMAVIGQEGISPPALIGVVEEVGPRNAKVLLVTDFSSTVSARVYNDAGVTIGVVQGRWQRGSRLQLEQVDRSIPLSSGNPVVTAGLSAQFDLDLPLAAIPQNVPIGTIEAVRVDGHNQIAEVRPYIDPDQVRYAWVILSQDE